jgi:hemoglobin
MSDAEKALFERIGGETAIMSAVTLFYEKVLADSELAPFFDGMDMPAQIDKQVAFMTMAFGGPHNYSGRDLMVAHAGLVKRGLNDAHFDRVGSCLKDSLDELGVDDG